PDINQIISMPSRPGLLQSLTLVAKLWKRYALAISVQAGDRPVFFAWLAGRQSAAPVESRLTGKIKRLFLRHATSAEAYAHRGDRILQLAEAVGAAPAGEVVGPTVCLPADVPSKPFAVVHATPMFRYKQWTVDGWRALARALAERN